MGQIKAVFFDVDGTTYQHSIHAVPDSTMKALKELKKQGIKLAICTSRVEGEMIHLPDEFLKLMDAVICSAGALIKINGEIFEEHLVDKQDAQAVFQYCLENEITLRWADDNGACFFDKWHKPEHDEIFRYLYLMVPQVQAHQNEPLVHLLLYPSSQQLEEIKKLVPHSDILMLKRACEVTAKNINKASGIKRLAEHWGGSLEETMAFGDGINDISMIQAAGIGVAMGNAYAESVKEAADYVTDSIDQDGVYNALVHFGLIEDNN